MTLEERITRLEDIEAIRYLQAKYQRCLDTRDFDGIGECFADDVVSSYGNGSMSYNGKEAVIGFLAKVMTLQIPSAHLIHGGEIDILDSTHAKAKWYLEDHLLHKTYLMKLNGAAIYYVDYRKEDGVWRITSIGYDRCFEYFEMRGPVNLLTLGKTTFLKAVKKADPQSLGKWGQLFQYKTLLYYTGTFNTRYVTDKLQTRLQALGWNVDRYEIDPTNNERLDFSRYDILGLGYPIYGYCAPWPFLKFIRKQKFPKGLKAFIYKNSGETEKANDASSKRSEERSAQAQMGRGQGEERIPFRDALQHPLQVR